MRKYLMELIGTFFLVLTVGCTVMNPNSVGNIPPLAIGSALMVMIYAGGHLSGAHYNPAVTLAVWVRGKCPTRDVLPYMVAQFLGGAAAASVALYLRNEPSTAPPSHPDAIKALVAEFLFTFALAFVVVNSATAKGTAGNSFYGLAIGFTVLTGAFAVGNISGGAFNPAVAVGITIMGLSALTSIWVFLVANFAGGLVAGLMFRFLNPEDV